MCNTGTPKLTGFVLLFVLYLFINPILHVGIFNKQKAWGGAPRYIFIRDGTNVKFGGNLLCDYRNT